MVPKRRPKVSVFFRLGYRLLFAHRFRSCSRHDDSVFHGIILLERFYKLCDRCLKQLVFVSHALRVGALTSLLANGNVDAVEFLLLISTLVPAVLIQDGVQSNSGLSSLAITSQALVYIVKDEGLNFSYR